MQRRHKVSAILCQHKGKLIDKAVQSLLESRNIDIEIIIASSDEECIKRFENKDKVRCFYVSGGPAHKRNVAFRFAEHKLIAFFDDDIEVTPYAVEEMVLAIQENTVGMVYGKLLNMEFRDRFDEAGSYLTWSGFLWSRAESGTLDTGQYNEKVPVLAGKSASCMIHRKIFSEVGMFDQSYEILGEETDLSWRVWLAGYKVLYVPSSVTFHAFNTKFKPADFYIPKRIFYNGSRNYLTMLYTNLGKKNWIIPIFIQLCVWTTAALGMLIRGKFEASYWIFRGISYFILNIKDIWKKRIKVQTKIRKISDKEIMPFILKHPPMSYYLKRFLHYILRMRHG